MRNPFDLFDRPSRLFGFDIVEAQMHPRYVLPEEIIPGVPWPPGFRSEINAWSRAFLGEVSLVPRGMVYMLPGNVALMRPEDIVRIMNCI